MDFTTDDGCLERRVQHEDRHEARSTFCFGLVREYCAERPCTFLEAVVVAAVAVFEECRQLFRRADQQEHQTSKVAHGKLLCVEPS